MNFDNPVTGYWSYWRRLKANADSQRMSNSQSFFRGMLSVKPYVTRTAAYFFIIGLVIGVSMTLVLLK